MKSASHALRSARRYFRPAFALGVAAASLLLLPTARADYDDYDDPGYGENSSYSYLRELDGSATLTGSDSGSRDEASINQPLLTGDQLSVSRGSRAEVVLADRNLLRLDGDTEVIFEGLAGSPDREAERTRLRLLAGAVQIVVDEGSLGSELPRIDTANSTIYLQQAGAYLVRADGSGWSEVVVRSGAAEVLTPRGSELVRDGEMASIEGGESARPRIERAPQLSALERWGGSLAEEAQQADLDDVDDSLHYSASRLDRYGSWVEVENRRAWRPSVASDWRPYTYGDWRYTPSGYTWVSSEPWGWVPYHYGTWDFHHGYGWVWYPGRVYSPAWVYWYWSPSYVGWCPTGYYTHYYSPHYRNGFRFGVYGWAGGDWGAFAHWSFLPTRRLHDHHGQERWVRSSHSLRDEFGGRALERGLITTDTRGVTPRMLEKPADVVRVLRARPSNGGADLPDVTPFVARRELAPEVARQVVANKPANRGVETPLRPVISAGGEKPMPAADGRGPRVVATKPKEESVPGHSGEKPRVAGRPADWREGAKPAEGRSGEGSRPPQVQTRPARPVEVKPAEDWRQDGRKPAQGVTVDRQPSARPVERKPAEDWRQDGGKPAPAPTVERRPAPRPVERKPAEGNPDSGVRLERRPANPVVAPRGEAPRAEPTVRPARPQQQQSYRPQPTYEPERKPQGEPRPERRSQDVGVRSSQPRPSASAPAPVARPQSSAPRSAPEARPAPQPRSEPARAAEPKREHGGERKGGGESGERKRGRPPA